MVEKSRPIVGEEVPGQANRATLQAPDSVAGQLYETVLHLPVRTARVVVLATVRVAVLAIVRAAVFATVSEMRSETNQSVICRVTQ